ncbi:MAG: ABC transporter permease [Defluviitaleaceae bacterium]|nr:ABC transporter permease [Defluviitaleaceae bacterium]
MATTAKNSERNLLIQEQLDKKAARSNLLSMIVPFLGLGFIFIFFTIVTSGNFISPINIENLIHQSFSLVIIGIGAAFVWAHGGKDMSIGPSAGCGMLVCALLLRAGHPLWLGIAACIIVTMVAASLVAGISILLNVPVFIGSMCVRTSFLGILHFVTLRGIVVIDFHRYAFMNNIALKSVVLIVFIAVGLYLFNFTSFGKANKAIGGNQITASQAGIKNKKNIFFAFLFMGLCIGVSALFSLFRAGSVTGNSASGLEFTVMIAMALGGIPMFGGDKTKLISAIVGAVTITFLVNGLRVWGLQPMLIDGVQGILFVIIIALSYDRSEGKLVS